MPNQYEADGLLAAAGKLQIQRDPAKGFVTGSSLDATTESRTYDAYGAEASYTASAGSSSLYSVTYTRDALGRIASKTERVGADVAHTFSYAYDLSGRLADVTKDGTLTAHYAYDANGNRTAGPGLTSSPVYDAQDRMLNYGVCSYTYKATGEMQTKTCPDGTTTYDALGNLRHVALPNRTQIDYVIDGQNRRVGKKVNGVLVEGFLYRSQLQPAAWLDSTGAVKATFVYGRHANVPEYMVQGTTTYRIITDQVGSVRLVANTATGAVVERIDWDEFGNVLADTAPGTQPFGFAGGLRDLDTGLTRFGARDYDPATARWTTKDPLRFSTGDSNLYAYCGNDPMNRIDVDGHDWRGIKRVLGIVWGLPQELIGLIYGSANWAAGGQASFSNNGILFEGGPIQNFFGGPKSAITLGHSMCLASRGNFVRAENGFTTADHEEQHTYQSEALGPFYLPAAGLSLAVGAIIDGDTHGPHSFMESGPQSRPPHPWP